MKPEKEKEDEVMVIGIDQYGGHWDDLGKHPRKSLLEKIGSSNAEKLYIDDKKGNTKHIGYIIDNLWITLYNLTHWEK